MRELSGNCIMEKCIFFEEPTKLCDLVEPTERPCILNPNRFEKDMEKGNYSRAKVKPVGMYQIHIGKDDIAEGVSHTFVVITPEGETIKSETVFTSSTGEIINQGSNVVIDTAKVSDSVSVSNTANEPTAGANDVVIAQDEVSAPAEIISTPSDTSIELNVPVSSASVEFEDDDSPEIRMNKKGKATIIGNKATIIK